MGCVLGLNMHRQHILLSRQMQQQRKNACIPYIQASTHGACARTCVCSVKGRQVEWQHAQNSQLLAECTKRRLAVSTGTADC